MKRFEKLTAEQVVDLFDRCRLAQLYGHECPLGKFKGGEAHACEDDCLIEWLRGESEMVYRWQTLRTQEDLDRMFVEAKVICCQNNICDTCRLKNAGSKFGSCFRAYLSELVEKSEVPHGE